MPTQPLAPVGGSSLSPSAPGRQDGLSVLIGTYLMWALLPLYWKQLGHVPPFEVLCHRSLWGFALLTFLLWRQKALGEVRAIFQARRSLFFMAGCSAAHIGAWGLFIWAIGNGRLLESSLGSYISPLTSVLSGFLFFRERPRPGQWAGIFTAAAGVLGVVFLYGSLPWVTLLTAGFSLLFTLCRKKAATVAAGPGLVADMLLSGPLLWGYLFWLHATGQGTLGTQTLAGDLWLIGAGIVTVVPQLGFAYGLSKVSLTTLSLLQYLPPTGAFLLGVFLFGETFSPDKVFCFAFIWAGVVIFTFEGIRFHRANMASLARLEAGHEGKTPDAGSGTDENH